MLQFVQQKQYFMQETVAVEKVTVQLGGKYVVLQSGGQSGTASCSGRSISSWLDSESDLMS